MNSLLGGKGQRSKFIFRANSRDHHKKLSMVFDEILLVVIY